MLLLSQIHFYYFVSAIHGRASSNKTGRSFLVGDADCLEKVVQ